MVNVDPGSSRLHYSSISLRQMISVISIGLTTAIQPKPTRHCHIQRRSLSGNMSEYKASCHALKCVVRAAKLWYRNVFFFCIYRSRGVCKKSHNNDLIYYNLQETLHTWSLSNIRGFPFHSCLNNLHCSCLRRSVTLIRPLKLTAASLVDASVYSSHTTHVMKRLSSLLL